MHPHLPVSWLLAFAACTPLAAFAQADTTPPTPPASAPASPAASRPAQATYRSVFEGYQPFTEEKVQAWKDSNNTVEKIGGWRAYAKEVSEPVPNGQQAAPATKAVDPHAGHKH
ncbi:MAG: hypothetical protein V4858_11325 [Pseudomonadota bacterium]